MLQVSGFLFLDLERFLELVDEERGVGSGGVRDAGGLLGSEGRVKELLGVAELLLDGFWVVQGAVGHVSLAHRVRG